MSKSDEKIDTSKLSVFRTDDDWVIAESEEEARQILKEFYDDEEAVKELELSKVPNDQTLTINTEVEDGHALITKTCGEWIGLNRKGYLCGTNF